MSASFWQKIFFLNSRGCRLAGLFSTPLHVPPASTKNILVVCHGFTGSKEGGGRALEMAEEFGKQGWAALLFDFAGCGESEGSFEELTLTGQIDDLSCALKWCAQRDFEKIVTLGRSFGGSTVICQAARDRDPDRTRGKDRPAVKTPAETVRTAGETGTGQGARPGEEICAAGVCTWAAPARLTELFANLSTDEGTGRIALAGEQGVVYLKKTFLDDLRQYDVAGGAARLSPRPLLLVHGTKDELVPPTEAKAIYRSAGKPKQLTLIDGADHQFSRHYRQVWQVVAGWLEQF